MLFSTLSPGFQKALCGFSLGTAAVERAQISYEDSIPFHSFVWDAKRFFPVTSGKDQLTTGEIPCAGSKRRPAGENGPRWERLGLATLASTFSACWIAHPLQLLKRNKREYP